ncbi:MAG: hypothetical protein GY941_18815 [Planctomycetes bacterium]|nr:hypothetical protein [Planctomycetota bacterium]
MSHIFKGNTEIRAHTMFFVIVLFLLLSVFKAHVLFAVETRLWVDTEESEFVKGKLENVSIQSTGTLSLSPTRRKSDEIQAAYAWCQESNGIDLSYIGTGDPGTIFIATRSGNVREFYKTPELHVQTIAIDSFGVVYAGTMPRGRIYRVTPDGEGKLFCDLPDPYVWDLVFDDSGNLYAATGDNGIIYKISSDGTPSVFFDSPSTNILDLVTGSDNAVYAACEPEGIIYKVTQGGRASVLYDTKEDEVHCLAIDKNDVLYAGTSAGTPPTLPALIPLQPELIPLPPPVSETSFEINANLYGLENSSVDTGDEKAGEAIELFDTTVQNTVYRIDNERRVRELLTIEDSFVLCLCVDGNDDLLVGTGNKARLLKIDIRGDVSLLYNFEESQVLDIITCSDGTQSIATGNNATVYGLTNDYSGRGNYESRVYDTSYVSMWGCISWNSHVPPQTGIRLFTRSGNSRRPDITWSEWSPGYEQSGEKITSPAARFIQYRVLLTTSNSKATPTIDYVGIHYLPQNQAPLIESVDVISDEESKDGEEDYEDGRHITTKLVSWLSSDPNGDTLTFDLMYRKRGEKSWKDLKCDIDNEEQYYWNTKSVQDGYYQVKIKASDRSSNPEALALTYEKRSCTFLVDNTQPVIFQVTKLMRNDDDTLTITGNTKDELCAIREIRYSIDTGKWKTIFPKDSIFDSKEETFQLKIPYTSSRGHNVVIEVVDSEGNIGTSSNLYIP